MLKRFFSIITISLIITGGFFSAYSYDYPVYADSTTDEWMNVTTNEQLVEAFKYYCKSRDLTIEGSIADGVTSFTTKTFNGICNTLGIDITALQAHLKYQTDSNLGLRFLFDTEGISLYNRIFAQFLQDNDLEVGDTNVNKTAYSGVTFLDYYNDTVLCTVTNQYHTASQGSSAMWSIDPSSIYLGTAVHGFDSDYFSQFLGLGYSSSKVSDYIAYTDSSNSNTNTYDVIVSSNNYRVWYGVDYYDISGSNYGYITIIYRPSYNDFHLCSIGYDGTKGKYGTDAFNRNQRIYPKNNETQNINITIVSPTINNNTYEGDTIINNNGDTNYYPDEPDDPDLPPSNPTIPDSDGWQNFTLPDMPNDWLIYGMEKKFPFDIPFNILFALSLLNHEPEIPKFEGDIDLQVCTWHYDIDLTPFDDIATIVRKFEVLAFIIGLAILTKNLINWG